MGVAPMVIGGLALANTLLNSGNDSQDPQITTVTPEAPKVPGQAEINQTAINRTLSQNPWTLSPYRTMDFFRNTPSVQNYVPQFNPQQGLSPYLPGNNNMLMGDWGQAHPTLQQPQYSPLAWAMNLGQLFSQLGGMYQGGMQQQQPPWQQQQNNHYPQAQAQVGDAKAL